MSLKASGIFRSIRHEQLHRPLPSYLVSKGEEAELIEEIIQQVLDAKQIDIKNCGRK